MSNDGRTFRHVGTATGNVSRMCVHGPAHEYQNPPDVHSLFVVPQLPSEPGHSRHRDEVPISRPTGVCA